MSFKQTWWDNNLLKRMDEFKSWIGGSDSISKKYLRAYIKQLDYQSVIDLGCGVATEYSAYQKELPNVSYLGIDSSKILYDNNTKQGIPMILASAEETGLKDNYSECVFSRHVLEHQPDFKPILKEMVRLASKEAIHVFFIIPGKAKSHIGYDEKENLYHNRYNEKEIEDFLLSLDKVSAIKWERIGKEETSLHIKL